MWPEDLFEWVLETLAEEIGREPIPLPRPMPCDRYVARSALQKALRRGEVEIALAALGTLFEQHPSGVWSSLVVIAVEDVGVAGMDTVGRVVAAARNKTWRTKAGGDWIVAAALVRMMAEDQHCQAACDLLMRLTNDPAWAMFKLEALDASPAELSDTLRDPFAGFDRRGAAALALGGGLAEEQRHHQASAVFEALSVFGQHTHVIATSHAAWRISRNPMALLLPLAWMEWAGAPSAGCRDDDLPPLHMIGGVPSYSLDQFTRGGLSVFRSMVATDAELRSLLDRAGVESSARHRVVGDVVFLLEGGKLKNRSIWPEADRLRLPHRPLPGVFKLGPHIDAIMAHIAGKRALIEAFRLRYLIPPHA